MERWNLEAIAEGIGSLGRTGEQIICSVSTLLPDRHSVQGAVMPLGPSQ